MTIFGRKTDGFVGETHHFRKPPFLWGNIWCTFWNIGQNSLKFTSLLRWEPSGLRHGRFMEEQPRIADVRFAAFGCGTVGPCVMSAKFIAAFVILVWLEDTWICCRLYWNSIKFQSYKLKELATWNPHKTLALRVHCCDSFLHRRCSHYPPDPRLKKCQLKI